MAAKRSMNEYIDETVKRYSALFTLPSLRALTIELLVACVFGGVLLVMVLKVSQLYALTLGLALGVTFFALTLLTDFMISRSGVKIDPVFNLRRCAALSFYSILVWFALLILGMVANFTYADVWLKFFAFGFCAALALRLIVFSAVSFAGPLKIAVSAGLQPLLYVMSVIYTASVTRSFSLSLSFLTFLVLSAIVTFVVVSIYMYAIDRVGLSILGVRSFHVLKAFMANWTEGLNAPFERLFERFSQKNEIQLSVLSFRDEKGHVKATMIVPAFHPGPFKNIGSSELPYMIQEAVETKLQDCLAMVPHGLSGHNLDLATQAENQLVLERILRLVDVSGFGKGATRFLQLKRNGAQVGCQVFNNCALVTLTLAPETMEDLPPDLSEVIIQAAKEHGFSTAIAVDAHNSINGPFRVDEVVQPLQEAASECLREASKLKPIGFQVGAARVKPKDLGLKQGMGPGGIAVLVVKTDAATTAYVTIDGNNMITGVREKILTALSEMGINCSEVFTTDSHAVNAVVMNARGYHPIGEAIDHDVLIGYVREATKNALADLKPAEAAWATDTISDVKVIGEKQIAAMSTLLDKALRRARNLAALLLPLSALILVGLSLML